jgi:2-keto-4-pentenoate hydratase
VKRRQRLDGVDLLTGAALGPGGRRLTLADAYVIQQELAQLLRAEPSVFISHQSKKAESACHRSERVGFKVANTNAASQTFLSVPHPFYGPILPSRAAGMRSEASLVVDSARFNLLLVEPEIALRVARDLPRKAHDASYSAEELAQEDAVDSVLGAIEIVHTSYADWRAVGASALIADLASNGCFAFGRESSKRSGLLSNPNKFLRALASTHCELQVNGGAVSSGVGSKALGGPLNVLAWLANSILKQTGGYEYLRKGDIISTGVLVDPPFHYAKPGDKIRVSFRGDIELEPVEIKVD